MGEFLGLYYKEKNNSPKLLINRRTKSAVRIAIKAISISIKYLDLPLEDLKLINEEYRRIFEAENKQLAYKEYREKLLEKHWQKLGVYID